MELLLAEHEYDQAWVFFQTLPDQLKDKDRLVLQSGAAAVETGNLAYVESIFKKEFSVIREGENSISDIWYKYKARTIAKERGILYTRKLLQEVIDTIEPPPEIDFRMYERKK